jgi:photosystem II stability/assembly factor-like uncharacterized protein
MQFWDEQHGIVFSDPVDGHLLILVTRDAGESWIRIGNEIVPAIEPGEAGFAASNSSLSILSPHHAWIGLGGGQAGVARVFRTADRGQSWKVSTAPSIPRSPSSGIFSLCFRDQNLGIAVGGNFQSESSTTGNVAISENGGHSWRLPSGRTPGGFRSCVLSIQDGYRSMFLCCGPNGTDASLDGEDWQPVSPIGFHTLSVGRDGSVWGAGAKGQTGKTTLDAIDGALARSPNE